MGIKVEVKENKQTEKLEAPCLMISNSGCIIYATDFDINNGSFSGMCMKGSGPFEKGHFSRSWVFSSFKPFTGSITLSNEEQ